ncbi:MAG TPA: MIP/aquaporin family protein, partial [Lacipirellulaceae bacterium]|nr:MIP/aquaporin family protein [Lacipirellulaceae bacterium]
RDKLEDVSSSIMGVFVAGACVAQFSGAHLNPAVTGGLCAAGRFDAALVPAYLVAQMAGAMLGALLVFWTYVAHYAATDDADPKLATFCTAPAIRRTGASLFSEVLGTFVLVLAVLLAAEPSIDVGVDNAKIGLGSLGALPVGLLVLAIGLSLGGTTGYAINPAPGLGPRTAHPILPVPGKRDRDWPSAWIPACWRPRRWRRWREQLGRTPKHLFHSSNLQRQVQGSWRSLANCATRVCRLSRRRSLQSSSPSSRLSIVRRGTAERRQRLVHRSPRRESDGSCRDDFAAVGILRLVSTMISPEQCTPSIRALAPRN